MRLTPSFSGTLLELGRLLTLLMLIVCMLVVFHTAFLGNDGNWERKALDSVALLAPVLGIALAGGMIFRPGARAITETLPVKIFGWSVAGMAVLFLLTWYLETHCIFYRDIRRV